MLIVIVTLGENAFDNPVFVSLLLGLDVSMHLNRLLEFLEWLLVM